jgi:polyisoprenoid-binding protein YceI
MAARILGFVIGFSCIAPALAEVTAYQLDPAHTQASFVVDRFGFTSIIGIFAQSGGTVWLDEDHLENSRVDAWVTTDSIWTSDATRDGFVRGKSWLDSAANPTLTFKSTKVQRTATNAMNVTGDLTVFGQTHSITFATKLNKIGTDVATRRRAAGFSLEGDISRKDFGSTTAPALIGDTVHIRIEALAELPKDSPKEIPQAAPK